MGEFFLIFSITFIGFVGFAWLVMSGRKKKTKRQQELGETCHSGGGGTCSSCSGESIRGTPATKLQTKIGPMSS